MACGGARQAMAALSVLVGAAAAGCGGSASPDPAASTAPAAPATQAPSTTPSTTATTATTAAVIDLRDPTEAGRWMTINDPVMGGLSDSNVTATADGLTFAGTVSLDNNGGFASARREPDPVLGAAAAGASTVRVDATGDGKTYVVQLRTAGDPWAYIQRFATQAGVSATYDLPVEGFEPVDLFLEPAPDAPAQLDPSTVDQVTIYILDKQDGPFSITLEAIELRR